MTKIAILAANYVGNELIKYVLSKPKKIEFVYTIDGDKYQRKIEQYCQKHDVNVHRYSKFDQNKLLDTIKKSKIDILFLLWWPNIIPKEIIFAVKIGVINLHNSYLPWNRGKHPYYWSIVDNNQYGVTIHFINLGIDQGDILVRKKIDKDITTTGRELYDKGIKEIIALFKNNYIDLCENSIKAIKQVDSEYSHHFGKELDLHSEIKLNQEYNAEDLINIIRARTFEQDKPSSFFYKEGKKYYIRLNIEEVKE